MVDALDCKGLMCPMPIMQLAKKIKTMKVGDEVEMISDDIGSKEDVPAWCNKTGNEQAEMAKERGVDLYACSPTFNLVGIILEYMVDGVKILGASDFLNIAADTDMQYFIG